MEDRLKKRRLKHFIFTVLGYLLGTIINDIFLKGDGASRVIIGVMFAAIVRGLLDLYENKRYPKIIEKEKQLEKDERLITIKNRAAYFMYNIMITILAILWLVFIVKGHDELANFSAILVIIMVFGMEICRYYWSKKI